MSVSHPELVGSFDVERSGVEASQAFGERLWWRCPVADDHVWDATVDHRSRGRGCPFCVGRRVAVSNCLATTHPEIAAQWHPTKNGGLTAWDVVAGTDQKVWWSCDVAEDHVWEASLHKRTVGRNCPFCAGQRVVRSNCLATTHPDLAAQWHPTKNGELTTWDVVAGSNKKVWWLCPVAGDHEWLAAASWRLKGPTCPFCCNRRVCGSNCMAATDPELARQLHPTLNGDVTGESVVAGTHKKLWWRCFGTPTHVWEQSGASRRRGGTSCRFC